MVKVTLTTISSVSRTIREASVDRFPSTTDSCSISAFVLFTWTRITSQHHKKRPQFQHLGNKTICVIFSNHTGQTGQVGPELAQLI